MPAPVLLYLLAINAAAFAAFALDKKSAVAGTRRISERTLLQLATIGGTLGALAGQRLLRHKTRKEPFRAQLWLIAAVQGALLGAWAIWRRSA